MRAEDILLASQVASGLGAVVAVIVAIVAIPRAMLQTAERRKSEYTALFFETLRRSMESCVALMRAMDERRTSLYQTVRKEKGEIGGVLEFLSVEMALDRFRSDFSQTMDLYRRATGRVGTNDLLGLFRLISHLAVLAEVHSQDTREDVEREVGHEIYHGDLSEHVYKAAVIVHWIENDVQQSDSYKEVKRLHPKLLSDMDEAYANYWKTRGGGEGSGA